MLGGLDVEFFNAMTMKQKQNIDIVISQSSKKYDNEPIGITGPPGIGKTTIGKGVAERLNIPFYDLDDLVSEKAGVKNTKEIIETKGRQYFYRLEHECLREIVKENAEKYIIAFGGGINCHIDSPELSDKNCEIIKENIFNILLAPAKDLDESLEILWPRLEDGKRKTGIENINELSLRLKKQMPKRIKEADRIIYVNDSSIEEIVSAVMKLLD